MVLTSVQTAHGLATACSHSTVAEHNPNCGSGPSGALGVVSQNAHQHEGD
jgi:hypothetical protein